MLLIFEIPQSALVGGRACHTTIDRSAGSPWLDVAAGGAARVHGLLMPAIRFRLLRGINNLATGGLDEEQIRQIQDQVGRMRMLVERKQCIILVIDRCAGKLTPICRAIARPTASSGWKICTCQVPPCQPIAGHCSGTEVGRWRRRFWPARRRRTIWIAGRRSLRSDADRRTAADVLGQRPSLAERFHERVDQAGRDDHVAGSDLGKLAVPRRRIAGAARGRISRLFRVWVACC